MAETAAALQAAKQALHQLHYANPSQIKHAEAALNQISASLNPQSALALADLLLHPPSNASSASPAETMHAFHLLEQHVLSNFAQLPEPFRLHVRQFALRLLSADPRYSSLHTNKAVSFFTAIAIREWPQRYPTFIDDVMAMAPHIACRVLTHLSDDIYSFHSAIHPQRLGELRHAMALTISTTLPFITSAADKFHSTSNWPALHAAVQCLRSFLLWASLPVIFSMRVPQACLTLLSNPRDEVRNEVLNALVEFVDRQFPPTFIHEEGFDPDSAFRDVFYGLLNVVIQAPIVLAPLSRSFVPPTGAFPPLKKAWFESRPLQAVDEQAHEFTVKLFEVLTKLGTNHFHPSFLVPAERQSHLSVRDRDLGAAFVDLMAAALSSPSYVLRNTVLPFFTTMTNVAFNMGYRSELSVFLVTRFLYAATAAVLKFSCHPDVERYRDADYSGDEVNFKVARRKINGRLYGALSVIGQVLPEVGGLFGLSRLLILVSLKPPSAGAHLSSGPRELAVIRPNFDGQSWDFGDFHGDRRTWRHCVDTISPSCDVLCKGAWEKASADVKNRMIAMQRQAFESIKGWSETDVLVPKTHALRVLSLLYIAEPPALDGCIEALGNLIDSPGTPNVARSRACVALRGLYQRLSRSKEAQIGRFANLLCDYAVNTLLNPKFREQDKTQLVEASVSCIMSIPDLKEAEQKIERMLMPLLDSLSTAKAQSLYQSPDAFLQFLVKGSPDEVTRTLCAFYVLSNSMQQIVRPVAKKSEPGPVHCLLSRAIAPKAVEIICMLVSNLHSFFNQTKFPTDSADEFRGSVLLPTCRDLVHAVNLDNKEVIRRVTIEHDSYEDHHKAFREGPSAHEERCYDILCSYGIDPPNPKFAWARESLQDMRICGYEIIRASIMSGVTSSTLHLNAILTAICTDYLYIEPLHLLMLIVRVLNPMLSYTLTATDPSFLQHVAQSNVPRLLHRTRDHIEASLRGAQTFSETPSLDISRDCGRAWLRRSAANLIRAMFPPREKKESAHTQVREYFPATFQVPLLGDALSSLWIATCSVGQDSLEKTSLQFSLETVSHAADLAPKDKFVFFEPFLQVSLKAAVLKLGDSDSSVDAAVGSMLSIIRKWPAQSERQLHAALGRNGVLQGWISETIREIAETDQLSKPKKHRQILRALVTRIADHEGTSLKKEKKVSALPEKLVTVNLKRIAKRAKADLDELELGEQALDSLFGGGDPL